jgi:hypothetical protein
MLKKDFHIYNTDMLHIINNIRFFKKLCKIVKYQCFRGQLAGKSVIKETSLVWAAGAPTATQEFASPRQLITCRLQMRTIDCPFPGWWHSDSRQTNALSKGSIALFLPGADFNCSFWKRTVFAVVTLSCKPYCFLLKNAHSAMFSLTFTPRSFISSISKFTTSYGSRNWGISEVLIKEKRKKHELKYYQPEENATCPYWSGLKE